MTDSSRLPGDTYDSGLEVRKQVLGTEHVARATKNSNDFTDELDERDENAISAALEQHRGTSVESPLQLTLGLIKDRRGEHEQAFKLLLAGKNARLARQPWDPHAVGRTVDKISLSQAAMLAALVDVVGVTKVFLVGKRPEAL